MTHEALLRQRLGRTQTQQSQPQNRARLRKRLRHRSATTPPAQPGSSTSAGSATGPDRRPQLRNTQPTRATAVADPHVS